MPLCRITPILLTLCVLAACQPAQAPRTNETAMASAPATFYGSDVRTEQLGGDFTLTGHHGRPVSLADYRGQVVALLFGYTHCPDVCPTNLFTLAEAVKQLGPRASEVQILFVSVDPQRDTPALLAHYVPAFHPDFVGLTAPPAQQAALDKVKGQYRVVSQTMPREDGYYLVDHSAGTYLIDRQGQVAVYAPHGQSATELAHDLQILLE